MRTREKQLEELEAKTAQLLAVMPSDTMLSSSQLSQLLPGLSSSMEGHCSPMSYTSSVMNNHHHHQQHQHQQQQHQHQQHQHQHQQQLHQQQQQQQDNSNLDPMAAAYTPNSKNSSLTAG